MTLIAISVGINSFLKKDLTSSFSHHISFYSSGSGCPFPRSVKSIIVNVNATPAAAPYATMPASAMV